MKEPLILDVRKLLCPLPVIRLQQTINNAKHDDKIVILASDPGVLYDIPTWCKIHGHQVDTVTQNKFEIKIEVTIKSAS